jgi:hypothetical protein
MEILYMETRSRVGHTEGLIPVSDGLVRHDDAALGEEVFESRKLRVKR